MKKTNHELIVEFFESRGGSATLGELLEAGRFTFAHKLTARLSELRDQGYGIHCERKKIPSQNVYSMSPPQAPESFHLGPDGQFEMFIGSSI